ncbi:septal ring lytic transglycosylase RlpA family protein [bacterium]|nr:septal ring lytic transglycosylase RlpA family protein [bacterium]
MRKKNLNIKPLLCLGGLIFILSSCASLPPRGSPKTQTGLASWYGAPFHGKTTSSKEIYNMYDLTAAHRTLPFGTMVMVTNLKNGKSVSVRINDRGPFVKGRVIDLSYAAARILNMVGPGVVPVKVEVLGNIQSHPSTPKYCVQVGAFIYKKNALSLRKKIRKYFNDVYMTVYKTPQEKYYRVRIKASTKKRAQHIARELTLHGYTALVLEERN